MTVDLLEQFESSEVLSDSQWRPREERSSIRRGYSPLTDITSFSRPVEIRFGQAAFRFSEPPPSWSRELLAKISELGELEEDWDSYGARPINPESAAATVRFVLQVLDRDTPMPSVVPTNRGGIQLEWHRAGADLEIQIESPERLQIFFEDERAGEEVEFTLTSNIERLIPYLERISGTD